MISMRARVWAASVRMPIWSPVNERAPVPRRWIAMASSAIVFCSPVEEQRVVLARVAGRRPRQREGHQSVRLAGHRRHDHRDAVPRAAVATTPRDGPDALDVGDARAAVLLDDQRHDAGPSSCSAAIGTNRSTTRAAIGPAGAHLDVARVGPDRIAREPHFDVVRGQRARKRSAHSIATTSCRIVTEASAALEFSRSRCDRSRRARAGAGTRSRSRRSGSRRVRAPRRARPRVPSPTPSCPPRAVPRARSTNPTDVSPRPLRSPRRDGVPPRASLPRYGNASSSEAGSGSAVAAIARSASHVSAVFNLARHYTGSPPPRCHALAGAPVQPGAERPLLQRRHALAEQAREHATEHVAGSATAEHRTAGRVEGRATVRCGDHRRRAFEDHHGTCLRREAPRCADPVAVDFRGRDAEQPSGLSWVRRHEDGASRLFMRSCEPANGKRPSASSTRGRGQRATNSDQLLRVRLAPETRPECDDVALPGESEQRLECRRGDPAVGRVGDGRRHRLAALHLQDLVGPGLVRHPASSAPMRAAPAASAAAPTLPRDPATTSTWPSLLGAGRRG